MQHVKSLITFNLLNSEDKIKLRDMLPYIFFS